MTTETLNTASANPFASRYINAIRFRMLTSDNNRFGDRLADLGGKAAIVGPHGSGKTTLLESLDDELCQSGWTVYRFRTTERRRSIQDMASRSYGLEDAVLIDGAGHIGPVSWHRLSRHVAGAGRLVITAHRPGRFPSLHQCETSLPLLDALVAELAPTIADDLRSHSHALYEQHKGNIRDVLRGLYDHWATLS